MIFGEIAINFNSKQRSLAAIFQSTLSLWQPIGEVLRYNEMDSFLNNFNFNTLQALKSGCMIEELLVFSTPEKVEISQKLLIFRKQAQKAF